MAKIKFYTDDHVSPLKESKAFVKTLHQKAPPHRLGFMAGQIEVPDDFDSMGGSEIKKMFGEGA